MNNYLKLALKILCAFVFVEVLNISLKYSHTGKIDLFIHDWITWVVLTIVYFGVAFYNTNKLKQDKES
jgi:hypothetical protein